MKIITNSQKETWDLAGTVAKKLKGGELIFLIGDLGSGKTTFAQGLAKALDIKEIVSSPTFMMAKKYKIKKDNHLWPRQTELWHFDLYRLSDFKDFFDIGGMEAIEENSLVLIEWPEKIKDRLPKPDMIIHLKNLGEDKREIKITQ